MVVSVAQAFGKWLGNLYKPTTLSWYSKNRFLKEPILYLVKFAAGELRVGPTGNLFEPTVWGLKQIRRNISYRN